MNIVYLDQIFPYLVLFYGLVMSWVYHSEFMMRLAEEKFSPSFFKHFQSHKLLGFICLIVGALWSLQNIWQQ